MHAFIRIILFISVSLFTAAVAAQDGDTGLESVRAELDRLKREYEERIQALERRLAAAEERARAATATTGRTGPADTAVAAVPGGPGSGNAAFNPAIGVIFEGLAWNYRRDPEAYAIPAFPLGGEAGPVPEGLSLGETEIDISANVDDKFTAWLTTPIGIEDGEPAIEIEEAWIETTALPAGFSARFGRYFSNTGYLNNKHAHAWDFIDQPLAYQAFLGGQYLDDGVQLRWLAPTLLYVELGAEVFRGDRYPAAGAVHTGLGTRTLFAHLGGDVGDSNSWLAGISYLRADSDGRPSGDEDDPLLFAGDARLMIADFVWKWSPYGNWRQKNLALQAGYLHLDETGEYLLPGEAGALDYDAAREGWYAQAVFQPIPRWRFGARYDALSGADPGPAFAGTPLDPAGHDPARYSFMLDWSNSEFSRLRLQLTRDEAGLESGTQYGLQYIHSIGAHGAHAF